MITKFLRRRNVNSDPAYLKSFSRIQVHANGDQTFKFSKKPNVAPVSATGLLLTEASAYLNTELGQRIVVE